MLDVSPPFLITASRRRRHSLILLSMKRCESFCHSVTIARSSHSTVLNCRWCMVDSLLNSTPNSVIHGVNIRVIRYLEDTCEVELMKLMRSFFSKFIVVRAMFAGSVLRCSVHL